MATTTTMAMIGPHRRMAPPEPPVWSVAGSMAGIPLGCWTSSGLAGSNGRLRSSPRAPERARTSALVPRYDSTTTRSVRTSVGRALGDDPALIHRDEPVGHRRHQRHVVLDHEQRGAQTLADPQQHRAERLGLPLGDAARGLVEEDHRGPVGDDARQVDDAARAGRQLAEELGAERAEAHQLDELVDALGDLLLGVVGVRQVQRRAQRVLRPTKRSRLTASASSTVMAGNRRASWNDRPRPRWARGSARAR